MLRNDSRKARMQVVQVEWDRLPNSELVGTPSKSDEKPPARSSFFNRSSPSWPSVGLWCWYHEGFARCRSPHRTDVPRPCRSLQHENLNYIPWNVIARSCVSVANNTYKNKKKICCI